jgi:hypothetical protein
MERLPVSINMPFYTSPTSDLRKLRISVLGRFISLDPHYDWLVELIRVCVTRCQHLDTLEIVLDAPVSLVQRIWNKVYLQDTETKLPLEVKRLIGVESVFSLVKNDHEPIIYKWTWRAWANS